MTRLSLPGALLLALTFGRALPAQSTDPSDGAPPPTGSSEATTRPLSRLIPPPSPVRLRPPTEPARLLAPGRAAPAPSATASSAAVAPAALRDSIVALARAQLGTRYVYGGTSPQRGFDCSGFIRYIAQALRLDVPRTAREQARVGLAVATDPTGLRPGDLLTFGRGNDIDHIGIYVGDGRFIHASTTAGRVIESDLVRRNYRGIKPWQGVRRLFADLGEAVTGDGEG